MGRKNVKVEGGQWRVRDDKRGGERKECECTCPGGKTTPTPIQNHQCMKKTQTK